MLRDRLYLRRRREGGWRPSYQTGRITRERAIETGYKQVARLASTIEAHTGVALESRHVLDFGCGWGRLAVPLAERCEHVYGVDVSPAVLREAERNAQSLNVSNIEWLEVDRLAELSGRYDLVISMLVFQHIPVAEGERLFAALVGGLRHGGAGAIQLALRPRDPWAQLLRRVRRRTPLLSPEGTGNGRAELDASSPRAYLHTLRGAYSLNRLGELLADAGVGQWSVDFKRADAGFDTVRLVFRKD